MQTILKLPSCRWQVAIQKLSYRECISLPTNADSVAAILIAAYDMIAKNICYLGSFIFFSFLFEIVNSGLTKYYFWKSPEK